VKLEQSKAKRIRNPALDQRLRWNTLKNQKMFSGLLGSNSGTHTALFPDLLFILIKIYKKAS